MSVYTQLESTSESCSSQGGNWVATAGQETSHIKWVGWWLQVVKIRRIVAKYELGNLFVLEYLNLKVEWLYIEILLPTPNFAHCFIKLY